MKNWFLAVIILTMTLIPGLADARGFGGVAHSSFSSHTSVSHTSTYAAPRTSSYTSRPSSSYTSRPSGYATSSSAVRGSGVVYSTGRRSYSGVVTTPHRTLYNSTYYHGAYYHPTYVSPSGAFWGFGSGLLLGSMMHPFGGVYGNGNYDGYHPFSLMTSLVSLLFDLIGLALIAGGLIWLYRRYRRKKGML